MATLATIQAKVSKGYAKAAQHLGALHVQYRTTDPLTPVISVNNIVQEIMLAFDKMATFNMTTPNVFGKEIYFALMDVTEVQPGDYFSDYNGTIFYAAGVEPLRPAILVRCTSTISVYRPDYGGNYGGDVSPTLILNQWPAAYTEGPKGIRSDAGTPGSVRSPWYLVEFPNVPGSVPIEPFDLIVDETGMRAKVSNVELTQLGYRVTVEAEPA